MQDDILGDLQSLINLLSAHPELPRPTRVEIGVYDFVKENLEEAQKVAKGLGNFTKDIDETFFRLTKTFGKVSIKYVFYRQDICIKRVIGTKKKTIMVPHPDAKMVEKEVEIEIIEWDCSSLLEGEKEDA